MGFFLSLFLFAVFFVLGEILRPKPDTENARPAGLGDFNFPTATEGRVIPLIWGTVKLEGPNVTWYGDLQQIPITQKIKTGLFSKKTIVTGYQYRIGIQFSLCRGPVDELRRVWIGDEVVYDTVQSGEGTIDITDLNLFGGASLGNGGVSGDLSFFIGNETQTASSYLSPFQQFGGDTPAYRGTCYAVWERGYIGNSTSIQPWKFELRRIADPLGLGADATVNDGDMNPMNVIYEIITNDEWGLKQPAADIDTDNFEAAAATLADEGNGFSFILDRTIDIGDLLREIERQIDGVVFVNRFTGKWEVKLARNDYDIDTVLQANEGTVVEIRDFTRGAWEDTSNDVRVGFTDRSRDYFRTYAVAQDMANVQIQGGVDIVASLEYPGVKDPTLANSLAWRDLRTLSFPLAKAKLAVDRSFFGVKPGEVIAFTDDALGLTKLPMRVNKINLGELEAGIIVLDVVQDVFGLGDPLYSDPTGTGWVAPADSLVAIPAGDTSAFEAPYGFIIRDPDSPGTRSRAWVGVRNQGDGAVTFDIFQRNASGTPGGTFFDAGDGAAFLLVGELSAILSNDSANPVTSISIDPDPDTKADLLAAFEEISDEDIGVDLAQLVLIGDEFFGVRSVSDGGTTVDMDTVYRGLLDTVPVDHAAGTPVFLVSAGGSLTTTSFPRDNNVHIKVLTESSLDALTVAEATQIELTMDDRDRRPIPPIEPEFNGTRYASTADVDTNHGSDLDDYGVEITYTRRDFRSPDEVQAISTDAASIQADFPSAHSTRYRLEVRNDPDGANTLLFQTSFNAGEDTILLSRTSVLRATLGILPTRLRAKVLARHDLDTETFDAQRELQHDLDVTFGDLADDFNLGILDTNDVSATWVAPTTGTYTFTVGTALATGDIQVRLNGGSWTTVISAASTSGTVAITASDDVEVRHTEAGAGVETFLEVDAPSSSADAFAILIT